MKQSLLAVRTDKDAPHDAESKNAELLTRAGFIKKEIAGVYSYLPLGYKVLRKIEQIIREEMNAVCAQELLMPVLTPRENWEKTGRADTDIGYTPTKNTILSWSHEEMVTPIAKDLIRSYRDFPLCLYHIQAKFRNEPRAKSGILRGREFLMKDAYSFHKTQAEFEKYYEQMAEAYFRVFERCGLKSYRIESDGGAFTKKNSDEFSVVTPAGEDTMIYCEKCGFAQNSEIAENLKKSDPCPKCANGKLDEKKCVEVGNIFDLGTKFSESFGFTFTDSDGKQRPVIMGCYGIGVSRLLGTVVEASHDEGGIIWPKSLAPFQVHIISLREDDTAERIAFDLEQDGYDVLVDERDESPGKKFADSDLLGIPLRVVVSKRTLERECVELRYRADGKTVEVPIHELPHCVWDHYTDKS
jgi:prolyl-tRNA synthetase